MLTPIGNVIAFVLGVALLLAFVSLLGGALLVALYDLAFDDYPSQPWKRRKEGSPMKLTRDSIVLTLVILIGIAALLGPLGAPSHWSWQTWMSVVGGVAAIIAGKLSTSPLPGKGDGTTISGGTLNNIAKSVPAIFLALLLGGGITLTQPACASVQTHVSTVADIANAGGKVEESAHAIFVAAEQANATIVNGQPLLARQALDAVAIAVNKIGHAGADLDAALVAYNAAKSAGSDTGKQAAAAQLAIGAIQQALVDIGNAVPSGTVQAIDQDAVAILGVVAQVKGAAL